MLRILKISLLVSVVVLLNAMTTLLFVQNAVPASAGPQCVTGDVNYDAAVDLGDPLYLLSYLFQGGPEPVACAQTPSGITLQEMDQLLNSYLPKPADYFEVPFLWDISGNATTQEIFVVPAGYNAVLTTVGWRSGTYNSGWWCNNSNPFSNLEIIRNATGDVECSPVITLQGGLNFSGSESRRILYPGDVLLATINGGFTEDVVVMVSGYYLKAF